MKKTGIGRILGLAIVVGVEFGGAFAWADIYFKEKKHTDAIPIMGQPAQNTIVTTWQKGSMSRTYNGDGKYVLLLADRKVLYMIDDNAKQYAEIPLDFAKMIREMAGEAPEAAEITARMPGIMKNMMQEISAKVTETHETKMIGAWNCRKYLVEMDMGMAGKTTFENWATQDLKIDHVKSFTAENAMMAAMPGFETILREMEKLKGVVVYSIGKTEFMGSVFGSTAELLEAGEKDAEAGTYDIPAGYTKVKMIGG